MRRRRKTSWIHRWSRYLMGGVATTGAVLTGYLTLIKFSGNEAACPIKGCDQVLSSDYATVFGLPLALFGCLAYLAMLVMAVGPTLLKSEAQIETRQKLEDITWNLLFLGGAAMMIFSGYLMYLLVTELKSFCLYCVISAVLSTSLFLLSLLGKDWEDSGQLVFRGLIIGIVTLVATAGVYGTGDVNAVTEGTYVAQASNNPAPAATTTSGPSEEALAKHLAEIGATKFGAWWCPHCFDQRQLFGKKASKTVTYVECSPDGLDAQPDVCSTSGVQSYPSWEINGEIYAGTQELQELAEASGYDGPSDFQYNLNNIPRDMPQIIQ